MNDLLIILFLIFAGQVLGSLIGLLRRPRKKALYASLAFAGTMMLTLSVLELVPESLEISTAPIVLAAFAGGFLLFKIIDRCLPHIHPELLKKEQGDVKRSVYMLTIGIALHNLPEGLAIGLGFALNPLMGITIALTIAAQDIPENIATIVPLYCLNGCRKKSFLILMATVLFELVGFLLGYFFLVGSSLILLGGLLSFAAGLMTYIAVDELLPAAKLRQYPKEGTISIILGFLTVIMIISMSGA